MKSFPPSDSCSALIKSLSSKNPAVRCFAASALGDLGTDAEDAIADLKNLLDDPNLQVAKVAIRSLAQIGVFAISTLTYGLRHDNKYVRREVVWTLAKMGEKAERAVPALIRALDDSDVKVRKGAASALAVLGMRAAEAVPALIQCLKDKNLVICRLAALALSQIGAAAVPALNRALASSDKYVCREAGWALRKMRHRHGDGATVVDFGLDNGTVSTVAKIQEKVSLHSDKATDPFVVEPVKNLN